MLGPGHNGDINGVCEVRSRADRARAVMGGFGTRARASS